MIFPGLSLIAFDFAWFLGIQMGILKQMLGTKTSSLWIAYLDTTNKGP